jgi:hypothetical protein
MGSVCGARAWTGEANDTRGKKKVGWWSVAPFKGSDGEGGPEGWEPCGDGAREKERGGLGMAWSSATAWQQSGRGMHERCVVARQWRAAGRRDADGVADRWAGA